MILEKLLHTPIFKLYKCTYISFEVGIDFSYSLFYVYKALVHVHFNLRRFVHWCILPNKPIRQVCFFALNFPTQFANQSLVRIFSLQISSRINL